jgi:hypothetical protein
VSIVFRVIGAGRVIRIVGVGRVGRVVRDVMAFQGYKRW